MSVGTDISTAGGLDPYFRPISGRRVVAEAVVRRLSTPRGGLHYAPDYGLDLREFLNEGFTPRQLFTLKSSIEAEVEKDPRIQSCTATLDTPSTDRLRIRLSITDAEGPFRLVLSVDQLTVDLLRVEAE